MATKKTAVRFAAAYIRVSTDDQTEYSPDAQRKAIENYAKSNGYALPAQNIFIDEGISGRKAEKRPAFMKMIARAKSKERPFEVILVHKFDRFARSREDSVVYKSLLKKECGVRVISITESIEDDKFSVILEAMLEAMAEYYSLNLSDEVKKGMTEKHQRGEVQTIAAFGYQLINKELYPHPEQAPILREIFRRFNEGAGYYSISRWLNDSGLRTNRGSLWTNRSVEYILRNPVYIGKLRWNPTGKTYRDFTNENIVIVDGKQEPLIDNETWETAQKRVGELKQQHKYHGRPLELHKHWLSGLVYCSECGLTMVFSQPHYWKCNGYTHGACRTSQHITEQLLVEAIIGNLEHDLTTDLPITCKVVTLNKNQEDETAILQAAIERINKKIGRLREAYLNGADDVDTYKMYKDQLEAERDELAAELAAAQNQITPKQTDTALRESIAETLKTLKSPTATKEMKANAANKVIEKCIFNKAKNQLDIYYRYFFNSKL